MKYILATCILIVATIFVACDINEPSSFELEYVVEGYLFAGEPLQEIRLSRTVPFGTAYVFEEQSVSNANVQLNLLDGGGAITQTLAFSESDTAAGIYVPQETTHLVQPLATYQLQVTFTDNADLITSTTVVPDTFELISLNFDSLGFNTGDTVKVRVTTSEYPGRQAVYIFS